MYKQILSLLTLSGLLVPVFSAHTQYTDVPEGSFYEEAVRTFLEADFLDSTQTRFRPNDDALRSEMVKLLVDLHGGILVTMPSRPSFDDVVRSAWYSEYMEDAGYRGWIRGDGNCFGRHPCAARPHQTVLRAEAAVLIVRVFGLSATGEAPRFSDAPTGQWYTEYVRIAADHCVLQGDSGGFNRVRPLARINRAEMITMLNRAHEDIEYNGQCESEGPNAGIATVIVLSPSRLRVDFTADVNEASAENENNYTITRSGEIAVNSAVLTDNNTVELVLDRELREGDEVRLSVSILTEQGRYFRDAELFVVDRTFDQGIVTITRILPLAARRLRVEFSADVDEDFAEDVRNYDITNGSEAEGVDVIAAVLVSNRAVELSLDEDAEETHVYRLEADLRTEAGRDFRDTETFRGFDDGLSGDGVLTIAAHTRGIDTTITPGTRRAVFGLELRASCDEDVTVRDLTIRHTGFGSTSGVSSASGSGLLGLTIMRDGSALSATVNTSARDNDTVTLLRFTNPLVIQDCEEESVTIAADFLSSGTGSTEHFFSLERASDVNADTNDVRGSYPVRSLEIQVDR